MTVLSNTQQNIILQNIVTIFYIKWPRLFVRNMHADYTKENKSFEVQLPACYWPGCVCRQPMRGRLASKLTCSQSRWWISSQFRQRPRGTTGDYGTRTIPLTSCSLLAHGQTASLKVRLYGTIEIQLLLLLLLLLHALTHVWQHGPNLISQ